MQNSLLLHNFSGISKTRLTRCVLSVVFCFILLQAAAQQRFSIMAFGDMPYHNPADFDRFKRLTQAVNAAKPAFSVHVGDIKNGASPCSDDYFSQIKRMFMQFDGPLLYTPGDNDWTDCGRPDDGSYNPEERLQKLRSVFYDGKQSLGKKPLPTFNQNKLKGYENFVENQYWEHNTISFGTIHVVGSNNNFVPSQKKEFQARDAANLRWLDYIFDEAERKKSKGLVIFTQASMNYNAPDINTSGHYNIVQKLRDRVAKFGLPVLLVYGDFHRFMVEKPLRAADGKLLTNFTSLMVFGDLDMHAVKIDIDPQKKNLFSFSEFWVNGN